MTRTTTTMTTTTSRAPTGRRKNIPAAARRRLVLVLAGINDFPVAVVEFSFSVHFVLCAENFIVVISK